MTGAEGIWEHLTEIYRSIRSDLAELSQEHEQDLKRFLSEALSSSASAEFAIALLMQLPTQYTYLFIKQLLELASYVNRSTNLARRTIFSCDRKWLLSNIVAEITPLLTSEESFLGLFQLANEISPRCGRAIFDVALCSSVEEVRGATSLVRGDIPPEHSVNDSLLG